MAQATHQSEQTLANMNYWFILTSFLDEHNGKIKTKLCVKYILSKKIYSLSLCPNVILDSKIFVTLSKWPQRTSWRMLT